MADIEEEVWRLPGTVKGQDVKGGGSHRPPSLSPTAKARLARIVRRSPEVMVKVTGRARGVAGLKAHLDYVTRNGKLTAETHEGKLVQDRPALRELHDDWLLANSLLARGRSNPQAAQSVGVILSMPVGSPRDRVQDAARTWARETFGERHEWIMVRHDDKDHPHVHVTVRAVGSDGKRLAPGPKDLQEWRERFARELRRLGVEAEATPRQARGQVQRSDRAPVHQAEQRGSQPKVRQRQQADAAKGRRPPEIAGASRDATSHSAPTGSYQRGIQRARRRALERQSGGQTPCPRHTAVRRGATCAAHLEPNGLQQNCVTSSISGPIPLAMSPTKPGR